MPYLDVLASSRDLRFFKSTMTRDFGSSGASLMIYREWKMPEIADFPLWATRSMSWISTSERRLLTLTIAQGPKFNFSHGLLPLLFFGHEDPRVAWAGHDDGLRRLPVSDWIASRNVGILLIVCRIEDSSSMLKGVRRRASGGFLELQRSCS